MTSFKVNNQKLSFDWSWHLECSCTIGWVIREGGPSGSDHLDVVGGVEADLAAAQLSFTPALLVLLPQLQQLLAWKEHDRESVHGTFKGTNLPTGTLKYILLLFK